MNVDASVCIAFHHGNLVVQPPKMGPRALPSRALMGPWKPQGVSGDPKGPLGAPRDPSGLLGPLGASVGSKAL